MRSAGTNRLRKAWQFLADRWEETTSKDPEFDKTTQVRTLAALLSILALLFPWVTLDGHSGAMNAAGLMDYSFTGPERGLMLGTSFLEAASLFLMTPAIVGLAGYSFFKNLNREHPTAVGLFLIVLPLATLVLARELIDSGGPALMGIPLPEWGMLLMIACNAGLVIHSVKNGA